MATTISQESVLNALRSVRDPDLHKDIVSLNFVKDLEIRGNDVSFSIELTTPSCPVRDEFRASAESADRKSVV
jgi:ATP-binding protein involved in chromosome partitioning